MMLVIRSCPVPDPCYYGSSVSSECSESHESSEKYYGEQQELLGKLNGYVEEMYNGQSVVQTFNYQERAKKTFAGLNEDLKNSSRKAEETTAGAVSPITTLVNDLGYVSVLRSVVFWADRR